MQPNEPDRRTGQACDMDGLRPAQSCSGTAKRQFYFAQQMTHKLCDNRCLGLTGCTGVPITKTNCWVTAGSTVTTSTMGTSADAGLVSRAATTNLDVIRCR